MLNYPGRVAAIDVHWLPSDSFYFEEAYQRIHFYEPPFMGMYWEPWLWFDGDQHGGFDYFGWEALIVNRMAQEAPMTLRFWGNYTPHDGSGTVYAQFRNDSTATLNGIVILMITEDSLFYPAPNGKLWHCHVPRAYMPDYNGTSVSIAPGDSVVVSQPFTIDAVWNDAQCRILAWLQDTVMQADSTYEIWQGGMVWVTELGIKEKSSENSVHTGVAAFPNPCTDHTCFTCKVPVGTEYTLTIYDVSGRPVQRFHGQSSVEVEHQQWNCSDAYGRKVAAGVYFYRFISSSVIAIGKVVVR